MKKRILPIAILFILIVLISGEIQANLMEIYEWNDVVVEFLMEESFDFIIVPEEELLK